MSTCYNNCTLSWTNCQDTYSQASSSFYNLIKKTLPSPPPLPVSLLSHISLSKLEGTWYELLTIGSFDPNNLKINTNNQAIYNFTNNTCGLSTSISYIDTDTCNMVTGTSTTCTFNSIDQSNINFFVTLGLDIRILDYKVIQDQKILIISSIDRTYFAILSNKKCIDCCLIEKILCFATKFGWILPVTSGGTSPITYPQYNIFNCKCLACPPQPCDPPWQQCPPPCQQCPPPCSPPCLPPCQPCLPPCQPCLPLGIPCPPEPCTYYNQCSNCKSYKK